MDSLSPSISRRQRVKQPIDALPMSPLLRDEPSSSSSSSLSYSNISSHNNNNNPPRSIILSVMAKITSRFPIFKKVKELMLRVPPRVRCIFVFFWFAWKVVLLSTFLVIFLTRQRQEVEQPSSSSNLSQALNYTIINNNNNNNFNNNVNNININKVNATKVLYIVTSLVEFNDGRRMTVENQDRFLYELLPVMINSVESMVENPSLNLNVDIFLVCGYALKPEREEMIRNRLPHGVGFQFWDDAIPLAYIGSNTTGSLVDYKRALARQHRFVIRDKFDFYDMFVAFEDDMLVHGHAVHQYLQLSLEIERLRIHAPEMLPKKLSDKSKNFFVPMTKRQLERVVPGFMRVEVIVNETDRPAQKDVDPIPIDHEFNISMGGGHRDVDPSICCHVHMEPNEGTINIPETPPANDLVVWETTIKAFSLRQVAPKSDILDWIVLMLGPGKLVDKDQTIGGFWSGRNGAFKKEKKPAGGEPRLLAQQGGWMATKEQLIRMNNKLCRGNFLPPFTNMGNYKMGTPDPHDDLGPHNVEFWSGSYQFFTGGEKHCNMQRIISMNPDHFSKHLLYHTPNNKQKQIARFRMVRANNLFGQLNHVRKTAEHEKALM